MKMLLTALALLVANVNAYAGGVDIDNVTAAATTNSAQLGDCDGCWPVASCDTNNPQINDTFCCWDATAGGGTISGPTPTGGYSYSPTNALVQQSCWVWDGVRWVPESSRVFPGGVTVNGNIVSMQGYGTNIISEGVTGCVLTGTNNGTIYIGAGSHGNVIQAHIVSGNLHIGTNSQLNHITAFVDGDNIRIDNRVIGNTFTLLAEAGGTSQRIRGNVQFNTISGSAIDGTPGVRLDVGNLTNCTIQAFGTDNSVMMVSNCTGTIIAGYTNVSHMVNAVIAQTGRFAGSTVWIGDVAVSSSGSDPVNISDLPGPYFEEVIFSGALAMENNAESIDAVVTNLMLTADIDSREAWDQGAATYTLNTQDVGKVIQVVCWATAQEGAGTLASGAIQLWLNGVVVSPATYLNNTDPPTTVPLPPFRFTAEEGDVIRFTAQGWNPAPDAGFIVGGDSEAGFPFTFMEIRALSEVVATEVVDADTLGGFNAAHFDSPTAWTNGTWGDGGARWLVNSYIPNSVSLIGFGNAAWNMLNVVSNGTSGYGGGGFFYTYSDNFPFIANFDDGSDIGAGLYYRHRDGSSPLFFDPTLDAETAKYPDGSTAIDLVNKTAAFALLSVVEGGETNAGVFMPEAGIGGGIITNAADFAAWVAVQ